MNLTTTSELYYSPMGSDPDLFEIVEMFVDEMPDRIDSMRQFFATQNWEELGRIAHQIKGAAGSYGFNQLTPAAAALESTVCQKAEMATIQQALDHLTAECGRLRAGSPQ